MKPLTNELPRSDDVLFVFHDVFHEVEATRFQDKSVHECGKVVSPTYRPLLPPGNIPGTHFC